MSTSPYTNPEDLRTGFRPDKERRILDSKHRKELAEFERYCQELAKKNRIVHCLGQCGTYWYRMVKPGRARKWCMDCAAKKTSANPKP